MPNLVWLASYPKSGNTWMRAFLTAYLAGPGVEIDLNGLDASLHAANRQLFDRVVGFASSDLTADEIDTLRPGVYRAFDEEAEDVLFLKTHDRWRLSSAGTAVFPADVTRMSVLIVRNPLAVAPSMANHYSLTIDDAIERMADPDFGLADQTIRLLSQLPQPAGSWTDHSASWLDQTELPVIVVRYEDLRRDPVAEFSRVLTACGFEPDEGHVHDAMQRTTFERLQQAEAEGGFRERLPGTPTFFRSGRAEGWRDELTEEQVARITERHGAMMVRLGYGSDMDNGAQPWTTPALNEIGISLDTASKAGSAADGEFPDGRTADI
jgi:aryl sulfotransferase